MAGETFLRTSRSTDEYPIIQPPRLLDGPGGPWLDNHPWGIENACAFCRKQPLSKALAMSTNNPFDNQTWDEQAAAPPPKPGMSTGTKVLLILLIIFGGIALLCCGGLIAGGIYLSKYINESVSKDPTVVRQVTQQIVTMTIPEVLKPEASFDMKMPITDQRLMTGVVYEDKSTRSSLFLAVFGFQENQADREQMQRQMEQSFRQQGFNTEENEPGNWESKSHEKEIEIRGKKVTFQFTERKNTENDETRLDVVGSFPGDEGPVMLMLSADTKTVNEEQAVKMLESIK